MIRDIKIWFWKRRARRAYIKYADVLGEYTCGTFLATHMSSRIPVLARRYNGAMEQLVELGEDVPDWRMSE